MLNSKEMKLTLWGVKFTCHTNILMKLTD